MNEPGTDRHCVLTINAGSSSIKFALFEQGAYFALRLKGEIVSIGTSNATMHITQAGVLQESNSVVKAVDQQAAAVILANWLEMHTIFPSVIAIGHRVVHGMQHTSPEPVTKELLQQLKAITAFDPEHLPAEIHLIDLFVKRFPSLLQVACFDTSFHTTMPAVAKLLPVPRRFIANGLQRYGFHGLSYTWLMEELTRRAGHEAAKSRIILAHLGSGASMCAVKEGISIDTSMGFTPAAGLPMGTRTGDIDPGIAWFMMNQESLSPSQFNHLVNHESGLLGISGISADMQVLQAEASTHHHAAAAVEFFCYQARKWVGAFAAALGGLDILVFSGGIGEHSPAIRSSICSSLGFLSIELDENSNAKNAPVISTGKKQVAVHVIPTNEELMIAKLTCGLIKPAGKKI